MNRKSIKINPKTQISITAENDRISLEQPLWTINWFNLKKAKLYNFYNILAFPHVKKAGARVHFKGYIKDKISGHSEFDREMLLIVMYPSAEAFLKMISSKLFLLKSIIRIKSVSRFIFGFTTRIGETPEPPQKPARYVGKNHYLVHHFQSKTMDEEGLKSLTPLFRQYNITNYFQGLKAASLSHTDNSGNEQIQPFFIDGTILIESSNRDSFDQLLNDPVYLQFKENCTENNIYHVNRVI